MPTSKLILILLVALIQTCKAKSCSELRIEYGFDDYVQWLGGHNGFIFYVYDYSVFPDTESYQYISMSRELAHPIVFLLTDHIEFSGLINFTNSPGHVLNFTIKRVFREKVQQSCLNNRDIFMGIARVTNPGNSSTATMLHSCRFHKEIHPLEKSNTGEPITILEIYSYMNIILLENMNDSLHYASRTPTKYHLEINGKFYDQCFCEELFYYIEHCKIDTRVLNIYHVVIGGSAVVLVIAIICVRTLLIFLEPSNCLILKCRKKNRGPMQMESVSRIFDKPIDERNPRVPVVRNISVVL